MDDADKKRAMFTEIFGEEMVNRLFGVREQRQELHLVPNKLFMRLFFMATAPAEPQPWFKPVMPTKRPGPHYMNEARTRHYFTWQDAEKECGDCYVDINREASEAWDAEHARERYLQWPAAWADEQLKRV